VGMRELVSRRTPPVRSKNVESRRGCTLAGRRWERSARDDGSSQRQEALGNACLGTRCMRGAPPANCNRVGAARCGGDKSVTIRIDVILPRAILSTARPPCMLIGPMIEEKPHPALGMLPVPNSFDWRNDILMNGR
jgi:hypothetical protein